MAELATVATVISAAASIGGTLLSAQGTRSMGESQQAAANYEADQMASQAGQERAAAQRAAMEERRRTRLAQSRAQALSAASGAGATDPTVLDIMGDLEEEGEYRALTALYEGEERARGLENNAALRRYEGDVLKRAAKTKATSTLLSGGSSLLEKYG